MKKVFCCRPACPFLLQGSAQTNGTIEVALISKSPEASAVADLLTVRLPSKPGAQLFERNEMERIFDEQGLSAMNTDDLKDGRILGAEGCTLQQLLIGRSDTASFWAVSESKIKTELARQLERRRAGIRRFQ